MDFDDIVVDDGALLADRLVRSLHQNNDGHLAINQKAHESSIEEHHNVAILYIYTSFDDGYVLHEHYVYSVDSLRYKEWKKIVIDECNKLELNKGDEWLGVYGWATAHIQVTPLRTGDLFIKIDKEGARGVRLTFDTRKTKRSSRKGAKREA
jgi:hypothetical protein